MNKLFDIGQWVATEDGYGQVLSNKPLFVEGFEKDKKFNKLGELKRMLYLCKILCDFDGNIRKRKLINIYSSISKIDKKGKTHVSTIKKSADYTAYLLYEDKIDICRQVFLEFKLSHKLLPEVNTKIQTLVNQLYPAFTFKDFSKAFKKLSFPFDIRGFRKDGNTTFSGEIIRLRFDSYQYKVLNKETVFHDARLFAFTDAKMKDF